MPVTTIHALPVELLASILIFSREALDERTSYPAVSNRRHLLSISTISSFWRRIALGTPRLWSRVVVEWYAKRSIESVAFLLEIDLARSKGALINVYLSTLRMPESHFARILRILSTHMHRCGEPELRGLDILKSNVVLPLRGPLNRLKRLTIHDYDHSASLQVFDTSHAAATFAKLS